MRRRFASLFAATLAACGDGVGGQEAGATDGATDGATGTDASTGTEGRASTPQPTTDPPTSTSDGPETSGQPTTGSTGETSGDTGTTGEPAEPGVHWVGRYRLDDAMRHRFGWSGAGFVVRFDGTGASVTMDDAAGYWTVVVDGDVQPTLLTSGGEQTYVLAADLPTGEHVVEVYRRTEGSFGPTSIGEVTIEGELLPPLPVDRRIEVIGDSISCGYGNEGPDEFCQFSAETENNYLAYGSVAARAVGAEVVTVAWSGKGMVFNYDTDTFEPLPEVYDRIAASEQATWDFSWQPDVVVINLGTNDFSTDGDPSEGQFVGAYVDFLAHLRDVYPDALLMPVAPALGGGELTLVEGYIQSAIGMRMAAGDDNVAFANINVDPIGFGCDYHPSVASHAAMADLLVEELATHLGW